MDIYKFSENIMAMDDETWARHANPISVFTRFTCLPLIVLDVWAVLCGLVTTMGAKICFVDRMVWIFDDTKQAQE